MTEPYETGPARAAPAHFPYDHPNMGEVKREAFFDLLAEDFSVSEAARGAHMTAKQAARVLADLAAEYGKQAA